MSLRLDMSTIARIEADRIYDLILPERMEGNRHRAPLVPGDHVLTTRQKWNDSHLAYITRALEKISDTARSTDSGERQSSEEVSHSSRPRFARRRSRRRGGHRERDAGAIIAEPN